MKDALSSIYSLAETMIKADILLARVFYSRLPPISYGNKLFLVEVDFVKPAVINPFMVIRTIRNDPAKTLCVKIAYTFKAFNNRLYIQIPAGIFECMVDE